MGINSIRKNLNKDTIISEIKLALGADIEKRRVCLVVEGEDDIKMLRKFCGTDIIIYESFSGKKGLEEIIASSVIDDYRVIGIRDRDYCSCEGNERIFFYDKCCMEMMILSFDETFQSIYSEFYNGRLNPTQLKALIFEQLHKVSRVRKYNEEKGLDINFRGLRYNTIINKEYKLEADIFIKKLKQLNPKKDICFLNELVKSEKGKKSDYLEITNGHDFISFFKALCDKEYSSGNAADKEISSSLRTSFNKSCFFSTNLYRRTNQYCIDHTLDLWES